MNGHLSFIRLLLTVAVAFTVLASTFASAQTKALVRVPFAFTANHQQFPAGYYKLELLSDRFLSFSDYNTGKHHAVILVQPDPVPYIETRGAMRFLRSGTRHYLTEIRFAGSSTHSAPVLQPSLERELAKLNPAGASIEIAMNIK